MLPAIIITGPVDWLIATGTVIAALMIILKPVRGAAIFLLSIRDQWTDIRERLNDLEQLRPNGGSSMADQVNLLRRNQDEIMATQNEVVRAVTELCHVLESVEPPNTPQR